MKKKIKYGEFDLYTLRKTTDCIVSFLEGEKKAILEQCPSAENIRIDFTSYCDYEGCANVDFFIFYDREETEEEISARRKEEAYDYERQRAAAYESYLKLKAVFEKEEP